MRTKDEGGLGLQMAKGRNIALLVKLNWRLNTEKEVPWAKVLRAKYGNSGSVNAPKADRLPCSRPLWQLIQGPLPREAPSWEVKDVILDIRWDWSRMPFDFPPKIKLMLQATPMPLLGRGSDKIEWMHNPRGDFDLKSAYKLAMGVDMNEWLNNNAKSRNNHASAHILWKTIFSFVVWNIWKARNSCVFDRKNPNPKLAIEIVNQAVEFVFCTSSPRGLTHTIIKRVRWERLPEGWVKLNTDRAAKGNLGLAGCGGVVRDENGKWLTGFSKRIRISTSFVAEL
nr:uncharacterized protein LOC112022645 [Quercus suber]